MLVLSRKSNEDIVIIHKLTRQRVIVRVADIGPTRVKLGFLDSQGNFTIIRKELDNGTFSKATSVVATDIQDHLNQDQGHVVVG